MKLLRPPAAIFCCAYLAACAAPAQMENMVYWGPEKVYAEELRNNVEVVSVTGGEETNPMLTSEISSEAFSAALVETLREQDLIGDGRLYALTVEIQEVEQPAVGLDMQVITHVRYTLTETTSDQVVFDELISAGYLAVFDEAFAGTKRLKIANEKSAKKNIETFLERLSQSSKSFTGKDFRPTTAAVE